MIGTLINVAAIIIGSVLGILFGARLPDRLRQTVIAGLGLFTLTIGIQMAIEMTQPLVVLGALLVGGLLGEWWQIEGRLQNIGAWLEKRFNHRIGEPAAGNIPDAAAERSRRFIHGFLTSSLLFTIGPMAILGSIQDGLTGDFNLLAIKSVLDGFASIAFASSLGIGVLFSSLIILVYQGSITLLAAQAQALVSDAMMVEMSATGGILLLGIAISSLLNIKPIRVGNFLPALLLAPLLIAILTALGILTP
ncbi:MAG: DUF554 domain-containing protein [Chloroflexi bacterium]|jgi:uncharacterized membrane protein YqgA involved in biofilm formation|nr:DUF554 domain-containing protein [Chloroflexota bacterium]